MKIPRFLGKNGTIGVTAPSFGVVEPVDIIRFDHAKEVLSEKGYKVKETPNVHTADETGRSSPMMQRVEEFYSLLMDDSVDCIVSASGGDYQCEMLMGMDWDLLVRYPKWFQGFSDNSILTFKITVDCDIATIYAGNFGDFGMEPWHRSISENLEFLEGKRTSEESFDRYQDGFKDRITGLEPFDEEKDDVWHSAIDEASFSGRLIGGCMDILEWYHRKGMVDVPSFIERYHDDGFVWYMETFDMDEERIRKMLSGMISDGWFSNVHGFVFGRPLFYQGDDYVSVIHDCLVEFDVPILFDADVGHKGPRMTFINGVIARFDYRNGKCEISYDFDMQ